MFELKNKSIEKLGERIGFIVSFFVFSTILYFILKLTHKLPADRMYVTPVAITFLIVVVGRLLKRLLK